MDRVLPGKGDRYSAQQRRGEQHLLRRKEPDGLRAALPRGGGARKVTRRHVAITALQRILGRQRRLEAVLSGAGRREFRDAGVFRSLFVD